jgi:hypothetical protein
MDQKYRAWLLSLNPEQRQRPSKSTWSACKNLMVVACTAGSRPASIFQLAQSWSRSPNPTTTTRFTSTSSATGNALATGLPSVPVACSLSIETNGVTAQLGGQRDAPSRN